MEEKNKFKAFLCSALGKAAMIVTFYAVILVLILFSVNVIHSNVVAVILCIALGYFGWKALSRITPNIFLFMPIGGWILYFVIKGALSFVIGVFVAPFVIAKKIVSVLQEAL